MPEDWFCDFFPDKFCCLVRGLRDTRDDDKRNLSGAFCDSYGWRFLLCLDDPFALLGGRIERKDEHERKDENRRDRR